MMKDWNIRGGWRCLWMFLMVINCLCYVPVSAFSSGSCGRRRMGRFQMSSSSSEEKDEIQKLKESALRLRQEAQDLESSLTQTKKDKPQTTPVVKEVSYTSINDSKWILTYRFANDPIQQEEEEEPKPKLEFVSGKVSVHFRSDGYTDILSSSPNNGSDMKFVKFWGWDEEVSPEDGNTYLLWSADVQWNEKKERFYFNAQVFQRIG